MWFCDLTRNDRTFPLSEDPPSHSFGQGHGVHIQRHQHQLRYNLEKSAYLHGQLHGARNHKDSAISESVVAYFSRNTRTHLLLISVFLDVPLIRLVWDPMAPAITQWGVILNAARLVLQTEICIDCQIERI
jgi:hypothetical protein